MIRDGCWLNIENRNGAISDMTNESNSNTQQDTSPYGSYLPIIDVNDGVSRVMNNKKLYFSLLSKFKGRKMADDIIRNIHEANLPEMEHAAHALKGVAMNLGLTELGAVVFDIEKNAKSGITSINTIDLLEETIEKTLDSIRSLLDSEI